MNKKGFTLIELLAVIIILAIVALVATPIIIDVIDDARNSAALSNANLVYTGINNYCYQSRTKAQISEVEDICEDGVTVEEVATMVNLNDIVIKEVEYDYDSTKITKLKLESNGKELELQEDGTFTIDGKPSGKDPVTPPVEDTDYTDASGANTPVLVDKLVPVVYEDSAWKVADTSQKWYDYDAKEWANAVVLETGVTKNIGDTLDVDTEVAQMYVWIPRYEYQIPEASLGKTAAADIQAIDIKFVGKDTTTASEGYNLHPGFTFGGVNQSGLWVGKFETTGEDKDTQTQFTCTDTNCTQKVTIKPGYISARNATVSNQFYASRSIASQYGITGGDFHMSKYTEWTAISYLTNSIYGRCESATSCTEITINNSSSFYTGNAANAGITSSASGISNAYDTTQGMTASTTGNITGVYDMSGGAFEYAMGVLLDTEGNPRSGESSSYNSGFNGMYRDGSKKTDGLAFPDRKYYDTFTSSDTSIYNYSVITHVNGVEGDYRGTFRELLANPYTSTTGWYGDYAYSVGAFFPWFLLGGYYGSGAIAGAFDSDRDVGRADAYRSFRVIFAAD